jgi:Fe-S oxidoreductase
MFIQEKCDLCGDCLVRCKYFSYDKDAAVAEIKRLMNGEKTELLSSCITCCACNEYCPTGANPFDLINELQERYFAFFVPKASWDFYNSVIAMPAQVKEGDPDKPALSLCVMPAVMKEDLISGPMFEGLTIAQGGDYFCWYGYVHFGTEAPVKKNAQKFVDAIASLNRDEVVFLHDDCYAMAKSKVPEYGISLPFKPVHILEYIANYLKDHQSEIKKLNMKVAYQRPCASRATPEKEKFVNEIFDLVGVEWVDQQYKGVDSLCCGVLTYNADAQRGQEIMNRNLTDMKEHGAESVVFLCPVCQYGLSEPASQRQMRPIHVIDLAKMALGEIS